MRKIIIWSTFIMVNCSSGELKEIKQTEIVDTSYFFTEEYSLQYKCPNCDELFDGHECENCHYIEKR